MKINVMGLLRQASASAVKDGCSDLAYCLLELGNNLRGLMRGEDTIEAWNAVYVGQDGEPFDIDKLLPVSA